MYARMFWWSGLPQNFDYERDSSTFYMYALAEVCNYIERYFLRDMNHEHKSCIRLMIDYTRKQILFFDGDKFINLGLFYRPTSVTASTNWDEWMVNIYIREKDYAEVKDIQYGNLQEACESIKRILTNNIEHKAEE